MDKALAAGEPAGDEFAESLFVRSSSSAEGDGPMDTETQAISGEGDETVYQPPSAAVRNATSATKKRKSGAGIEGFSEGSRKGKKVKASLPAVIKKVRRVKRQ